MPGPAPLTATAGIVRISLSNTGAKTKIYCFEHTVSVAAWLLVIFPPSIVTPCNLLVRHVSNVWQCFEHLNKLSMHSTEPSANYNPPSLKVSADKCPNLRFQHFFKPLVILNIIKQSINVWSRACCTFPGSLDISDLSHWPLLRVWAARLMDWILCELKLWIWTVCIWMEVLFYIWCIHQSGEILCAQISVGMDIGGAENIQPSQLKLTLVKLL